VEKCDFTKEKFLEQRPELNIKGILCALCITMYSERIELHLSVKKCNFDNLHQFMQLNKSHDILM